MLNGRFLPDNTYIRHKSGNTLSLTRSHPPLATPSSLRNLRCSGWWGVQLAPHRWRQPQSWAILERRRTAVVSIGGGFIPFCGSSSYVYLCVYYTFESEQRQKSNSRYGLIVFTKLIIHYQWMDIGSAISKCTYNIGRSIERGLWRFWNFSFLLYWLGELFYFRFITVSGRFAAVLLATSLLFFVFQQ